MTVAEIQGWTAIVVPSVITLIVLYVSVRTKDDLTALTINVDGRLTALLAAKDAEASAKISEATALGAATGRAEERGLRTEQVAETERVATAVVAETERVATAVVAEAERVAGAKV